MLRRALHFGIWTGTAATACMTLVMLGSRLSRVHQGKHPPEKSAEKSTEGIIEPVSGRRLSHGERAFITAVADESYGVAAASLFACLWQRFGPRRNWPLLHGMLFSLGLWALRYKGRRRGLRLMPSPKCDRPGRVITSVAAHLVYGAVLGANARKLEAA